MPGRTKPPYPTAFRQQMIELVKAGRSPDELAREFGCTAQSIHNWLGKAVMTH
jgi:transposase